MSSRDRDTKSLHDKLKVFWKKGGSAALPARSELLVTAEMERELGRDAPPHRRLRALRDLTERVHSIRVQEGAVKKLWTLTRDLLEEPGEGRLAALGLMRSLAEAAGDAPPDELSFMRSIFLRHLRDSHAAHAPDDAAPRFRLLHALTNSGKNIKCFEEQIGPFLLEWLPSIQSPALTEEFLQLIINVVKFNATYLDEEIVHGFVNHACHLAVFAAEPGVVGAALALLEAVVCYSLLPRAALRTFVAALCRSVNLERYCQASWKLMRSVLGADIGHAALRELVGLLRDGDSAGLQRGACFYINMALWGGCRVPTLHASLLTVLPAFLKALDSRHPVVTYEVVLALQSLVTRVPGELHEPAWDNILDILLAVIEQDRSLEPPNELIHSRLHALITSIEQLQDAGQYCGDGDKLLALLDACGHERPEASALRLVSARAARLAATGAAWLPAAHALAERYVRLEPRLPVRTHALAQLLAFVQRHRALYGEELVERLAVPVLGACALDAEAAVRAAAARALAELARGCSADPCTDLIDLLEKILNRPFEMYVTDVPIPAEADASDLLLAAEGLLQLLHDKLLSAPASHAARCLLVLLDHLDLHYKRPALFQNHPDIRVKILEMLFGLRANALNCVGFCYDASGACVWGAAAARLRPVCSPFLLVEAGAVRAQPAPPAPPAPAGACVLPAGRVARALLAALLREADWAVLAFVLRALPALLHARALVVGRRPQELDLLAATLCGMVAERGAAPGAKPLQSELHGAALPALAALAPYHAYLEPQTQQRIVRCLLKFGMVLRAPQPFLAALTLFTLETRDTMVKMLPEVLLDLSKVSDTKAIASPMLEFLSTLTRLPKVFASFVEDQYMSVFAILLPYTNPSRYNHYVVSLAHHVVAAWFLKCRLSYRRNFVQFIIHGLHNYIIMPFEEQLQYKSNSFQPANEDSSNRQRSSSLGSKAVSRAPLGRGGAGSSAAFHVELTETCVDLLARYASTPCSVKPARSDTAAFLFAGGPSATWLVGHKLVTITTAGCAQQPLKAGACERCAALCRGHQHALAAPLPPLPDDAKRQNSAESTKSGDPVADALSQFSQRFERVSKEVDSEETAWGRAGALSAAGACPCWCAGWAELTVRAPTGDVSWVLRAQNQMSWDHMLEWALQDVAALVPPPARADQASESSPRSRSGSGGSAPGSGGSAGSAAAGERALDLHKSSSDSVVSGAGRAPHAASHCIVPPQPLRSSTQPINIPGSPQRQSSSSTTDDDDLLLIVPEGKSRHPVRRSNSSPEMSSSWKLRPDEPDADDMILLPSCEPTGSAAMTLHASKKAAKKSDMRVSCEAIPEEMSGTSPHAARAPPHPSLMTYNSDPGTADGAPAAAPPAHHQLQKTASDSTVTSSSSAHKPPRPPPGAPSSVAAAGGPLASVPTAGVPTAGVSTAGVPTAGAAAAAHHGDHDDLPPLQRSRRSHTISVMSPTRKHRESAAPRVSAPSAAPAGAGGAGAGGGAGGGVAPSFVFLQLYHNMSTYPMTRAAPGEAPAALHPLAERPLRVAGVQHERTIKNLDLVPPVDTYKVGVLYVGPGQQDNEVLILKNSFGSVRYAEFLTALGSLVSLTAGAEPDLFLNLERGGRDGTHTYVWRDDVMQVLFHVATAMPSSPRDPTCNEKRKYIGNDFVSIVYNDSGADFNIHTIKGQANFCIVVVEPYEHGMNRVLVKSKDERIRGEFLPHLDTWHVSDAVAALLARQLALHCALAAQIAQSLRLGAAPYASNSLERLRIIKRLRRRLEAERLAAAARPDPLSYGTPDVAQRIAIDDFNDYT